MPETRPLSGIHHVTAIASDPRRNLDFYTRLLGLRLVKRTVNFDDPGTYHFYLGDETGAPGTILTFFPFPGARRGSSGPGQATSVAFAAPPDALEYWRARLDAEGVVRGDRTERFGEWVLPFLDPDGLRLEIVAADVDVSSSKNAWTGSEVPLAAALRGFHSVTLGEARVEPTASWVTGLLGFAHVGQDGNRTRYQAPGEGAGLLVDLVETDEGAGRGGAGTVHHVAWRASDDEQQARVAVDVRARGGAVSPVRDRQYFRSIYFREPGGVLFEVATDGPGFARDEAPHQLGQTLKLPPWLESDRDRIQSSLPEIDAVLAGVGS